MLPINVIVATTTRDLLAQLFAEKVALRSDMDLVGGGHIDARDVASLLEAIPALPQCAVILVGRPPRTREYAQRWLSDRPDLVVMVVDLVDQTVQIAVRNPGLDSVLSVLRGLIERIGTAGEERVASVQLQSAGSVGAGGADQDPSHRQLLAAAIDWTHRLLRDAIERVPDTNGDVNGFSVTRATLLQSLDASSRPKNPPQDLEEADARLKVALAAVEPKSEPLALAARTFGLSSLEFKMMVLGLAPELDLRFQRCIGFLLDEMPRRVGTLGLFSALLGSPAQVRGDLAQFGALARWLVFEGNAGREAAADEPLRLDSFFGQWLLGDGAALGGDPRIRRILHLVRWSGAGLLQRSNERATAAALVEKVLGSGAAQWIVLPGTDAAGWRALVDLGASLKNLEPIRVDAWRLAGLDIVEVEDCARRVGRMARLAGRPLAIDVSKPRANDGDEDGLRVFFATIVKAGARAAVICVDDAAVIRLLGVEPIELINEPPLSLDARVSAMRLAANEAGAYVAEDTANEFVNRYPVQIDGLEHAMTLARNRAADRDADDPSLTRFSSALKEVVSENLSHLAERIEPLFSLDQVVLPPDRHRQLIEIVDNVRLAPHVLDEWKFGKQLPYGRGVTALFFGPSGTGKTMAAIGIAHQLGIQILRLDLSRVVSKYIGDTEKNIDCVFGEAERSGSAILIDEADSLLAKRSEVKDAHDRYANIEVAFLLQRMEAYGSKGHGGLAILTTNMKQTLDSAFLRRLRFIMEFPRPNAEARERIWRQCLPEGSHVLDDAAFKQLGRRIDLTGGHIRQITLRAAFIAAAAGTLIDLTHIAHAATAELAKLGMPAVEIDLGRARQAA